VLPQLAVFKGSISEGWERRWRKGDERGWNGKGKFPRIFNLTTDPYFQKPGSVAELQGVAAIQRGS